MTKNLLILLFALGSVYTYAQVDFGNNRGPCFQKSLDRYSQQYVDWECDQNGQIVDCNDKLELDPDSKLVLSRSSGYPYSGDCESCYMNGLRKQLIHFAEGRVDGVDTTFYKSGCPQVVRNHIQGIENGTWTYYNDTSGLLAWEINYYNGEKEGKSMYFKQHQVGTASIKVNVRGVEKTLKYPTYENDTAKIEYYRNGLLEGVKKEYWPGSKLRMEADYSAGVLNGSFLRYDIDGNVLEELNYKDGQKDGPSKYYYNDGSLLQTENWKKGVKDGEFKIFYIQGYVQSLETYKKGLKHGKFMERFPDNKIKREAEYKKDKLIEEHVYDKYGNEIRTVGDKDPRVQKEDDDMPDTQKSKKKKKKKSKKDKED